MILRDFLFVKFSQNLLELIWRGREKKNRKNRKKKTKNEKRKKKSDIPFPFSFLS